MSGRFPDVLQLRRRRHYLAALERIAARPRPPVAPAAAGRFGASARSGRPDGKAAGR